MALLLTVLMLAAPVRATVEYKDVAKTHWAYTAIGRTEELGLVGGVGGGRFGLGQKVTRAEYAAMLCRLMGWPTVTPKTGSFADNQDPKKWYYSAVETAYANGALRKIGEDARVNDPLTREELAVMTVRALGYAFFAGIVQDDCPFTDVSTNRGYITLAYHMGFMNGATSATFAPAGTATREQAAVVLLRVYDAICARVARETVSELPEGAVPVESLDDRSGRVPMCPRAPLEGVYAAALKAGKGGAVALRVAAYDVATGKTVEPSELESFLADSATRVYRSTRYESSYATRGDGAVWFESEGDIAEKVMLCRLLGIKTVYLIQ